MKGKGSRKGKGCERERVAKGKGLRKGKGRVRERVVKRERVDEGKGSTKGKGYRSILGLAVTFCGNILRCIFASKSHAKMEPVAYRDAQLHQNAHVHPMRTM